MPGPTWLPRSVSQGKKPATRLLEFGKGSRGVCRHKRGSVHVCGGGAVGSGGAVEGEGGVLLYFDLILAVL